MKIGVDAGCLGIVDKRLKVGVYQMAVGLLRSLAKIDKQNNYILYSFIPIDKKLITSFGRNFTNKVIKPSFVWSTIWLPLEIRRNNINVFLGLSQNLPSLPKNTKGIVVVFDLTFEKHPSFFPKSYNQLRRISKYAVGKADIVVAVSHATKKDIIKIYPGTEKKIEVIYAGFDNRFENVTVDYYKQLKKMNVKNPFFLFVGSYKESKNITNLIKAFSLFCVKNDRYNLVLVGSNFWMDKSILSAINESSYKNRIKLTGFVSDENLYALYKSATVFVSPAFNEGFGLTYLEAATFKLPIVASKNGSVFEIFEDSILYCDPSSPDSIVKNLTLVVNNSKLRKKLTEKAYQRSKIFTWDKSAKKLLNIIEEK